MCFGFFKFIFYPQIYNGLVLALNIDNSGSKTTVLLLGLLGNTYSNMMVLFINIWLKERMYTLPMPAEEPLHFIIFSLCLEFSCILGYSFILVGFRMDATDHEL